jgi:hypothetical protein
MNIVALITDYSVLDRIINHLKLRFIAEKPSPPQIVYQEVLMTLSLLGKRRLGDFRHFWRFGSLCGHTPRSPCCP